jgi:hypothetical protein
MNPAMKVFISCGKEDQAIAQKLYNDLKKAGVSPWIDSEDILPGQNWKNETRRAIQNSNYFIMLLSSTSLSTKGFVHKEQKIALDIFDEYPDSQIFIIPARLDNCELFDERLQNIKPVDLFPSYEDGLKKILKTLGADKGKNVSGSVGMKIVYEIATGKAVKMYHDIDAYEAVKGGYYSFEPPESTQKQDNPKETPENNSKDQLPKSEEKSKTLSPFAYAVISFISFMAGVGLLCLFIFKAKDLVAQGIDAKVFYILLIPLGLCAAAFLFGAMSSIASYQGNVMDGRLRLGGPVIIFVLVIIGGFRLMPDTSSFDITVFVHGLRGQHDIVLKNTGEVMIDLGGDRRTEKIGAKGEASFHSIPANFRNQPVSISVIADGFEPANSDKKYDLKEKSVYVMVRKDDSRSKISGCVKDAENKPLKDVDINLPNCLLVKTGADGCFNMQIPPECQKEKITLTASKDGYDNWTGAAHPETGQEIGIVMNRKEL